MDYCLVEARYGSSIYSHHVYVHDWTLDGLYKKVDAN